MSRAWGRHTKPFLPSSSSKLHTRKHRDSASFLPDSLGPLTKRRLNSSLSKTGVIAFALRQLGAGVGEWGDYHCPYTSLHANGQYGHTCALPSKTHKQEAQEAPL